MSVFILDTRNQKDDFIEKALKEKGHSIVRSKLPYGDIALSTNILNVIDIKSSGGGLIELAGNRCSKDHDRMKREIINCLNVGGKITFLCFENGIKDIDDIVNWEVPTFKSNIYVEKYLYHGKYYTKSQMLDKGYANAYNLKTFDKKKFLVHKKGDKRTQVKPSVLMKSLKTMCEQDHYKKGTKVNLYFATKENCGDVIESILIKNKD